MVLCGVGFSEAWQGCPRGKKRPPAGNSRQRPEALGAPLTWLFLVGLRPRRARLRFTRQNIIEQQWFARTPCQK